MRQRLGLADALVKDPSILMLDEPTVNIDPEGVRELLLLVERLRTDQGITVLLSSHLLHQVEQVCDRIGIFVKGRLVAVGTVDELAADLDDRIQITVGITGIDNPRAVLEVPGVTERHARRGPLGGGRRANVRDELVTAILAAGGGLTHLTPRRRRPRRDLPPLLRRRRSMTIIAFPGHAMNGLSVLDAPSLALGRSHR